MCKQHQTSVETSMFVSIGRCIEYVIRIHPDGQDPAAFEAAFTTGRRASWYLPNSFYFVAIISIPRCSRFLVIYAKLGVEYEEIESVTQDVDDTAGDFLKIRDTSVMKDLVLSPRGPAAGLG